MPYLSASEATIHEEALIKCTYLYIYLTTDTCVTAISPGKPGLTGSSCPIDFPITRVSGAIVYTPDALLCAIGQKHTMDFTVSAF